MKKNKKNNNDIKLPEKISKVDLFFTHYFVIGVAFVLILGLGVVLKYTHEEISNITQKTTEHDAISMAETIINFRRFYSRVVLPPVKKHGMTVTHDYKNIEGSVPLPASFVKDFGSYISPKNENYKVNLYSDKPYLWRKEKKLDAFQKSALASLRKNPDKPVTAIDIVNGKKVLRYARADVLKKSCLGCHNSYQGTPKTDWKVGDVRGALEVSLPFGGFLADTETTLKNAFLMMLAIILSMISLLFVVIRKMSRSINIAHDSYEASERDNKKLITEIQNRKKVTHALKTSELKTRAIVNSVGEVIIVINTKGIVMECNDAIISIFGYQPAEVIGQNISMLMTQEHAPHHDGYLKKYLETGEMNIMGKRRELFAKRRSGEVFPVELSVNDMRVGNEVIWTGTIRDITHRRNTEKATEAAHKAAIESAKLKSDFLANMSHEIRTPMNGVLGMTQVLLESELNKEQKGLAETVKDSAESLLVIINDILDFSKIEAGKLSVKKLPFKLLPVIEGVVDLVEKAADNKFIDIAFFMDTKVPESINSDAGRLRQILINLLNNALKFTDSGHVTLHVSMAESTKLRFEIIDTGLGIPEDQQATLFDSFSQVDSSSTREYGGTGLGLAICKQLVELMGGEIGVQSKPDVGSTFWFTVETDEFENDTRKGSENCFIEADINVLMLSAAHLLNRYHEQQMKQWKMHPTIVTTQNQFVNQIGKNRFDLLAIDTDTILIDPDHPEDTLSFLKMLRKKTNAPIVLYARLQQYKQLEQLQLGWRVKLIQKPIKHTVIKNLLSQIELGKNDGKNVIEMATETAPRTSPAAPTKTKAVIPKENVDSVKNKHHILLAEDNRVNQKVATAILSKLGYKVTVVANGKEALKAIENELYDLVLMDCQMPILDGYEASSQIRKLPETHHSKNIPIIAFTANAMKEDADRCKQAGMDDYVSKPVRMEELKTVLENWSDEMKKRQALRTNVRIKGKEIA